MEHYELAPGLNICRVLNGMWQVAGGHGHIDPQSAISEMEKYHESGFTTWDLADIYGPAEDFIGEFREKAAATRKGATLGPDKMGTRSSEDCSPDSSGQRTKIASSDGNRDSGPGAVPLVGL